MLNKSVEEPNKSRIILTILTICLVHLVCYQSGTVYPSHKIKKEEEEKNLLYFTFSFPTYVTVHNDQSSSYTILSPAIEWPAWSAIMSA